MSEGFIVKSRLLAAFLFSFNILILVKERP